MAYDVIVTDFAQEQLDNILGYICNDLKNRSAAESVADDYEDALNILERSAESFAPCEEPELMQYGYYRFHLKKHRYIILYRVENKKVYIDRIYHELQDYVNLEA